LSEIHDAEFRLSILTGNPDNVLLFLGASFQFDTFLVLVIVAFQLCGDDRDRFAVAAFQYSPEFVCTLTGVRGGPVVLQPVEML